MHNHNVKWSLFQFDYVYLVRIGGLEKYVFNNPIDEKAMM